MKDRDAVIDVWVHQVHIVAHNLECQSTPEAKKSDMSSVIYLEFENARYEYALSCEEY